MVVKRSSLVDKLGHLQHEADILGKIKSVVPRVPRLIACDKRSLVLLLQPVGLQFASRVSHYTQPVVRVAPCPTFSLSLSETQG